MLCVQAQEGPVPEDPFPEDPVPEDPVPEDPVPAAARSSPQHLHHTRLRQ